MWNDGRCLLKILRLSENVPSGRLSGPAARQGGRTRTRLVRYLTKEPERELEKPYSRSRRKSGVKRFRYDARMVNLFVTMRKPIATMTAPETRESQIICLFTL